jgi:hypothetical protein
MTQNAENTELLHEISTRVSLLENEVSSLAGTNKWIRGTAVIVVLQIILFAVGYGRLAQQVSSLSIVEIQGNVATALAVLRDHGVELTQVRAEQARLRGAMDQMRVEMAERTRDRFTSRDGERLISRVQRLEDILYAQD